jgi:peptidyl-prolyl cis-trans isomerase C
MNPRLAAPLLALALVALAGCDREAAPPEPQATASDPDTLALVNGAAITRSDVFSYAGLGAGPDTAGTEGVLEELINLELLRQRALELGIDQESEIRTLLRNIETNLLASQVIERKVQELEITEAQLEAEYQAQVSGFDPTEYRARHILVETEGEASALAAQLIEGADFATLAREHSVDGSAARGGDLGWFAPAQMVPAFSSAATALQPGEFTREPVRSDFGWHLILLEDTRELEPPALQDVRTQLEEILQARALQAYMDELRAGARIEIPERPAQ